MLKIKKRYKKEFLKEDKAKYDLINVKKSLNFNESKPKRRIKLRLAITSSFILAITVIVICLFLFTDTRTIPTYLGMEVVDAPTNISLNYMVKSEDIKESDIDYYAKVNERLVVAIYLDNPDDFEIVSLVINDTRYSSFNFADYSTNDTIYIIMYLDSNPGIETLYIDELRYIDKDKIENAKFAGDRSIFIAKEYDKLPEIKVIKEEYDDKSYVLDYDLFDYYGIVTNLNVLLYLNNEVVNSLVVDIKQESIKFNNLLKNTTYKLVIYVEIDILNGMGITKQQLYESNFTTDVGISYTTKVDDTSLTVDYTAKDDVTKVITKLYYNDELISEQNGLNVLFNNLLTNKTYLVEVSYEYLLLDKIYTDSFSFTFETKQLQAPKILDFNASSTPRTITYDYKLEDIDNVITNKSVNLYLGEQLVQENGDFVDLFSNCEYKLSLVVEYDLLDGNGKQYIVKELVIKTKEYQEPTLDTNKTDLLILENKLYYNVSLIDENNLIKDYTIDIYADNNLLFNDIANSGMLILDKAYSNVELRITITYDLFDGNGERIMVLKHGLGGEL